MHEQKPSFSNIIEHIFSNRNKRYGAYDLRKQYIKHLRIAFFLTISLFILFISIPYFSNWWHTTNWFDNTTNLVVIPVKTDNQLKLQAPPPLEKKTPTPQKTKKTPTPKPKLPPKPQQTPNDHTQTQIVPINTDQPTKNNTDSLANSKTKLDSTTLIGQHADSTQTKKKPFKESDLDAAEPLDTLAMFPGGMTALYKYIYSNVRYPATILRDSIEGTIMATFVVNIDGSVSDVVIPKEARMNNACDDEVIRVLRKMPNWTPARRNGQRVKSIALVKVSFIID